MTSGNIQTWLGSKSQAEIPLPDVTVCASGPCLDVNRAFLAYNQGRIRYIASDCLPQKPFKNQSIKKTDLLLKGRDLHLKGAWEVNHASINPSPKSRSRANSPAFRADRTANKAEAARPLSNLRHQLADPSVLAHLPRTKSGDFKQGDRKHCKCISGQMEISLGTESTWLSKQTESLAQAKNILHTTPETSPEVNNCSGWKANNLAKRREKHRVREGDL